MARDLSDTDLYHITDVANLPGILASGGLLSDAAMVQLGLATTNIGHNHIKHRRMTVYQVPCAGNRYVGEFVPFYYCPRSPMLYTVNLGNTGRNRGCQSTIVHLVTTVADALAQKRPWAISDMNAGSALAEFSDEIGTLEGLDWGAIRSQYWRECAMKKAAEFLVADRYEWTSIRAIICFDAAAAASVRLALQGQAHQPVVSINRNWYY